MTTIATDGKSMAADGLVTGCGIVHCFSTNKLTKLRDGRLVGGAGSLYDLVAFTAWMEKGGEPPALTDDFEALVLDKGGNCWTYNCKCYAAPQEVPAVTGSGSALALGAMLAGADPRRAVEIACLRDTHTGGTITVEEL